jgi:hypothetical protein
MALCQVRASGSHRVHGGQCVRHRACIWELWHCPHAAVAVPPDRSVESARGSHRLLKPGGALVCQDLKLSSIFSAHGGPGENSGLRRLDLKRQAGSPEVCGKQKDIWAAKAYVLHKKGGRLAAPLPRPLHRRPSMSIAPTPIHSPLFSVIGIRGVAVIRLEEALQTDCSEIAAGEKGEGYLQVSTRRTVGVTPE